MVGIVMKVEKSEDGIKRKKKIERMEDEKKKMDINGIVKEEIEMCEWREGKKEDMIVIKDCRKFKKD